MLEEVGAKYEYKMVPRGQASAPEFLATNPAGLVPFIQDGEFALGESMAINFYLAEKYRPELMPSTPEERARVYYWSFWAITNVQPKALDLMQHTMFLPDEKRDLQHAEHTRSELVRYLAQLEAALRGPYLLGENFTVGDVNVGSVVNLLLRIGVPTASCPKVDGWMQRLRSRPAYERAARA